MNKPRFEEKDGDRCLFHPRNRGLGCERKTSAGCPTCGWNPDVEKERRRRLRLGLPALEKREPECMGASDLYDEDGNEIMEVTDAETDD